MSIWEASLPLDLLGGMVSRDESPEHLNQIANDPSVRGHIGGEGTIDLGHMIDHSYFLVTEHGGFVFQRRIPGRYCLHTLFLPSGRGRHAAKAAQDAARWMFCNTDADELITYSIEPHKTRPPRTMGWRDWFHDKDRHYRLDLMGWASCAPRLVEIGHWFHETLEAAKQNSGSSIPAHDDHAANNRFAGMALAMCLGGQPDKGVHFYNRWAEAAGFEMVSIESRDPLTVNTVDARWVLKDQDLEVVPCQ